MLGDTVEGKCVCLTTPDSANTAVLAIHQPLALQPYTVLTLCQHLDIIQHERRVPVAQAMSNYIYWHSKVMLTCAKLLTQSKAVIQWVLSCKQCIV